nr:hypothetical protein [Tanacetum cinerariifolium]
LDSGDVWGPVIPWKCGIFFMRTVKCDFVTDLDPSVGVGRRSLFFCATMVLTTWVITDPLVHSCLVRKGLLHEMKNRIMVEGDSS